MQPTQAGPREVRSGERAAFLVQQLEGHILQPVIQRRLVAIHPLAVVLAVAGGSIVAGLAGAMIAAPRVAVANVLVRYTAQVSRGQLKEPVHDPAADEPDPVQAPAS